MRNLLIPAAAAVLFLACPLRANLVTTSFDDVQANVVTRQAELVGDLDKTQKKLQKTYAGVLKLFAKESASTQQDAALIRTIVTKLVKALPDDAEMAELLDQALSGFQDELTAALTEYHRAGMGVSVLDAANKKKKGADKAWNKASDLDQAASSESDLKLRAGLVKKLRAASAKAWKVTVKALAKQQLTAHQQAFLFDLPGGYEDAGTCIGCHADAGNQIMASGHWNWSGISSNIEGHEGEVHGKQDLINNFCIAVPSNEGRCTQCHIGIGWKDTSFDFNDASAIDCLVCHDATGTYAKGQTTAGAPVPGLDLDMVALHASRPGRSDCGACHFFAGGGDNVKHGDLGSVLASPTRAMDVHMGTDGQDMACQECHRTSNHQIAGMSLHSTEAGPVDCTDCHDTALLAGTQHAQWHLDNVACQTCHIPTFSRDMPTKVSWLWSTAGQDINPIPVDEYGMPTYDKKKGSFVWQQGVTPTLRWASGKWTRMILNVNDQYETLPVSFAAPVGAKHDGVSKIYPFKRMVGDQPADAFNRTLLVPHLFGSGPGPNPYWAKYDWGLALAEGAAYAGQPYSGTYEFVPTEMYLSINHEVAPKEQARQCNDCHNGGIDFTELGYSGDPLHGGK